ncbi:MAG: response regulator [candidate division NC10 bacterium]|nr:response regulator [candidate division NC10 bacterium]
MLDEEAPVPQRLDTALASAGSVVECVQNGAQALAALAAGPPDRLVLDTSLPDVDGWEVLRGVREGRRTRSLPVLVLTGPDQIRADQALALGAEEFLTKPVSARVLTETVGRLVARPATAGAPGPGLRAGD